MKLLLFFPDNDEIYSKFLELNNFLLVGDSPNVFQFGGVIVPWKLQLNYVFFFFCLN